MVDDSRNPLELESVVRRFAESGDALAGVRAQLQALSEFRESEERVNGSLHDAAEQVARFVSQAATILEGLEEAQGRVAAVLQSGANLLDGTELREISDTGKANALAISSIGQRVEGLEHNISTLTELVTALQTALGQHFQDLHVRVDRVHEAAQTPVIVKRLW